MGIGVLVAKGRPRRTDVARDDQGRIAASEYRQEDPRTAAQWNRLRDVAAEMMIDTRLTSQAGRLFYNRQLTPVQFEAADRWTDYLARYDQIKHGQSRSPRSPSLEFQSPGEPRTDLSASEQSFLDQFARAHSALLAGGKLVEAAVNRLCRNEGLGAYFSEAKSGLDLLAAHWLLTGAKKSGRR